MDAGEQPPQNAVMVLRSAADFSRLSKPELLRSFALCGAQRKPAISVPDGDAPAVLIKKKKKKNHLEGLVDCCSVNLTVARVGPGEPELGFLSNTAADAALRGFTSRRWFLLCALTCTDSGGPVLTPAQLLPAAGVGFQHEPS